MKKKKLKKVIRELIEVSFKNGRLIDSQITRAIRILKSLPKDQAVEALTQYVKQLKRLERKHTMHIETVIPLSSVQLKKIKRIIEKKTKITKVITQINPAILGGFILRVGDSVLDESILNKVNQVKEAIINAGSN